MHYILWWKQERQEYEYNCVYLHKEVSYREAFMTLPFPSISQRELSLICDTKLCPLRILGWFSRTL